MPIISLLIMVTLVAVLAGCTTNQVRGGLYEGFRVRNDLQNSPAERVGKPEAPNFNEYERQRREQTRKESQP
jgi:hypothetical protein